MCIRDRNYDMPFDREAYVHRIGRTGRAGRNGEAILFVNPRERSFLSNLERAVGQPIEKMEIPDNDLINNNRIKKLQAKLIKAASTERDNPEEANILEELIKNVEKELDIDPKDLTLAALNLAVGFNALLENGNEDWIRQSAQRNTRNDRRDNNKFKQRRRGDFDNNRLEDEMDRFRVEVGHRDRVKPGNLVGAIANEAGLKGRSIGRIRRFENYSLVDLPKQMPDKVFQALKKVKVMNRELQINRAD